MSDMNNESQASVNESQEAKDFIRTAVQEDLAAGRYDYVRTRFPPEPNGYLHIGHAKAICIDFGVAEDFGGQCNLRYDDTNPVKEDVEYVDSIKEDIRWLGFDWEDREYYASDYFEQLYQWAVKLIKKGKAYVDDLSADEIREYRGTLTEPGMDSPYRNRSVEENLDLFERMRKGEFLDGARVLRAGRGRAFHRGGRGDRPRSLWHRWGSGAQHPRRAAFRRAPARIRVPPRGVPAAVGRGR